MAQIKKVVIQMTSKKEEPRRTDGGEGFTAEGVTVEVVSTPKDVMVEFVASKEEDGDGLGDLLLGESHY